MSGMNLYSVCTGRFGDDCTFDEALHKALTLFGGQGTRHFLSHLAHDGRRRNNLFSAYETAFGFSAGVMKLNKHFCAMLLNGFNHSLQMGNMTPFSD